MFFPGCCPSTLGEKRHSLPNQPGVRLKLSPPNSNTTTDGLVADMSFLASDCLIILGRWSVGKLAGEILFFLQQKKNMLLTKNFRATGGFDLLGGSGVNILKIHI